MGFLGNLDIDFSTYTQPFLVSMSALLWLDPIPRNNGMAGKSW